jgi:hypothetical protein
MATMKVMGLFNEPYSGRLRVHEANAEVVLEIGGARIPVTGVKWTAARSPGAGSTR